MEGYDDDDRRELWQLSDQLRLHSLSIADSSAISWSPASLSLPTIADRYNYCSSLLLLPSNNNSNNSNKINKINNNEDVAKSKSYFNKSVGRPAANSSSSSSIDGIISRKTKKKMVAAWEALPNEEAMGGYIFVCNEETMEENLRRRLFGLPSRYGESVRAIRPGMPLFLYNYSTHQLHGIFEAASFGGSNIDPTAWESDTNCHSPPAPYQYHHHHHHHHRESRFPAQVRVATRKICEPLEEDAFRPVLHHYDGPKFRLQLTVAETISLLDLFAEKVFA